MIIPVAGPTLVRLTDNGALGAGVAVRASPPALFHISESSPP